ncbi:hypothetical protein [Rhizobium sp. Rhizsp82]|uniref:hypothetical protein n=1 Tax=Rhizobium sp. Rhizsp82 TaxID=3243057 RepID=UPI0039B37D4E
MPKTTSPVCQWTSEAEAFKAFATHTGKTQSAGHIKPIHWYVASRLVLEGGFDPEWITPRPPFRRVSTKKKGVYKHFLEFAPELATGNEQTILGGLKTKNVDVVVSAPGLGPVLAVSCKGVTKAFRNLSNRLEETIGECTNLHITYPALVLGYLAVLRANRDDVDVSSAPRLPAKDDAAAETPESAGDKVRGGMRKKNDLAFKGNNEVNDGIERFARALSEMTGRRGVRDEISRYEAITLVMIEPRGTAAGSVFEAFPEPNSDLHLSKFFKSLYDQYSERFVTSAPLLSDQTLRKAWERESQVFKDFQAKIVGGLGYQPNLQR